MKWQLIENAPKDGSTIIGSNGIWVESIRWWNNGAAWTSEYSRKKLYPTHWMPMPNPPK